MDKGMMKCPEMLMEIPRCCEEKGEKNHVNHDEITKMSLLLSAFEVKVKMVVVCCNLVGT